LLEGADLRLDLAVSRGQAQRRAELKEGRTQVAQALEALPEEPAGRYVVGSCPQDGLELGASRGEVAGIEEGTAEGHARRGIGGVDLQPGAGDADGLAELTVLPELLGELREEAGAGLSLEALAELVDARVGDQDSSG
jgi:hypothetical protein